MMVGRKSEYPEKTPDDDFQKMPHTKAQTSKPPTETGTHTAILVAL